MDVAKLHVPDLVRYNNAHLFHSRIAEARPLTTTSAACSRATERASEAMSRIHPFHQASILFHACTPAFLSVTSRFECGGRMVDIVYYCQLVNAIHFRLNAENAANTRRPMLGTRHHKPFILLHLAFPSRPPTRTCTLNPCIRLSLRVILPWVRVFVAHELDEMVVTTRNKCAQDWTYPVYPVIMLEVPAGHTGPKRARRVQAAARVVDASNLGDEEREANANGSDEGVFALFGREHQDCVDEPGGEKLQVTSVTASKGRDGDKPHHL